MVRNKTRLYSGTSTITISFIFQSPLQFFIPNSSTQQPLSSAEGSRDMGSGLYLTVPLFLFLLTFSPCSCVGSLHCPSGKALFQCGLFVSSNSFRKYLSAPTESSLWATLCISAPEWSSPWAAEGISAASIAASYSFSKPGCLYWFLPPLPVQHVCPSLF